MENKILKQIKINQMKARKEKNKFVSGILTTLIGEIVSVGKNNGNRETTEEETIKVITKFKKGVGETIAILEKGGADSKELENFIEEVAIYEEFLPTLMTEKELEEVIKNIVSNDSEINIGKVMKTLQSNNKGLYDGKLASKLARKLIS
jgi:uncharacterized protein YqeY